MINIQINSTDLKDNTELLISEVEPGIISLYIYDPDDRHNGKYITVHVSNLQKAIDFSGTVVSQTTRKG